MLLALAVSACLGAQPPKLGQRAPDEFGGKQHTLLLIERGSCSSHSAQVLNEAAGRLANVETTLVVAHDAAAAAKYGDDCAAFLIDKEGSIRRVGRPGPQARDLVDFVDLWRIGKDNFDLACKRCHGVDGNLDDYPKIKKLGGIGNRLTPEEILSRIYPVELTRDEITVRSHLFTRRELDALIVYVSGL